MIITKEFKRAGSVVAFTFTSSIAYFRCFSNIYDPSHMCWRAIIYNRKSKQNVYALFEYNVIPYQSRLTRAKYRSALYIYLS